MEVEQLSFFSLPAQPTVAVCCMDGQRTTAAPAENWMSVLVHGGEYMVRVAGHPLVLKPVPGTPDSIQSGHEYYHYTIGERLFSGVFVGRERART